MWVTFLKVLHFAHKLLEQTLHTIWRSPTQQLTVLHYVVVVMLSLHQCTGLPCRYLRWIMWHSQNAWCQYQMKISQLTSLLFSPFFIIWILLTQKLDTVQNKGHKTMFNAIQHCENQSVLDQTISWS